jgi:hypothetical protein
LQGPIAQAVGLTIFGNDFLRGYSQLNFWPRSSVFAFCKTVAFVSLSGPANAPNVTPFAPDPTAWFAALRGTGVTGLRLHHFPSKIQKHTDRMTVAFVGGGGRWLIEAVGTGSCDHWDARWRVQDRNDPEREIWEVAYGRLATNRIRIAANPCDLAELRHDLKTTLAAIAIFADKHALDGFSDCFRQGIARLDSADPLSGLYHSDFDQCHVLPLVGRQLIGAAEVAWVFGGMGSWNDLSFKGEDGETYSVLSDRVFALLIAAIVEGANSSFVASAR